VNLLIRLVVLSLLKLRYRLRVTGLDEIARRGTSSILFLPNHPGLVDPVIVVSQLYPRFRPRPLADQDQVGRPVIRWLAARMQTLTIPDPVVYGDACRDEVAQGLDRCIAALLAGENVLIYPSGHIMQGRYENLAAASAVETILRRAPDIRVVLVRTRGLWGSSFSRAGGAAPQLGRVMRKAARVLLANGLFFSPRREVTVELREPADLPRHSSRSELNRFMERFYNEGAPPNTYVPYTIWEKGGPRPVPEPSTGRRSGEVQDVPAATREQVLRQLRKLTGRATIHDDERLAADLNLDSLSIVELAVWVQSEFGFAVGDGTGLETVGDVLLAARGHVVATASVALKPIPSPWFASPGGSGIAATPERSSHRASIPKGDALTTVFLDQARCCPDRVILADQVSGVKTYRDIITAILALRPAIARIPGDYVGLMLPASVGATVAYLATLFAGKIPVMVNWTVGARNMTHSLDLLGVKGVLTSGRVVQKIEAQAGSLGELKARLVMLEDVGRGLSLSRKLAAWMGARVGWRRTLGDVKPPRTAVVLFTSGSESLPKAVPLTHENLLTNLRDVCTVFRFGPADRLIGILPPFHSFGLTATLLLPLCAGVPVAYHSNPTEGAVLARLIEAYRVTLLVGTPTFLAGILRAVQGDELATLRAVISGAEKCPAQVYEAVGRLCPQLKVIEGYGITECSPAVALGDDEVPQAGTIGKVLPCVEYAVLDQETGRRVEPGSPGMLLVRGPSIFGGYLNYDGPSPFAGFEGRLWYRTGDLVVEGLGGVLTFVGRLKRFVKLGGEMISLPAIEEVLMRHYGRSTDSDPVLAVEASAAEPNPELILFTVRDLDREEVNNQIKVAGLSSLHNIRIVRRLDKIPTLGTGKIDYRALRTAQG
jgi:acyl-[acyl-carrier-protein]-phospholipid O-acyltransferase/long-chain-fatty-acid--[acyl-carrier-protein] ligase